MKQLKSFILAVSMCLTASYLFAQANPSVGILPLNPGGVVAQGAIMDVKVTVNNTLAGSIPASKLRPIITIPAIATILPDAQQTGLPPGWTIVSNVGTQIRVCNGSDVIGGNEQRDIIIKVQGATVGGPTQCQVQMNFGGATCATTGPQPSGNLTVDDFATSSVTVIAGPLPLTLTKFSASVTACKATLYWQTENELNSSHFDIERFDAIDGNWKKIGTVAAASVQSSVNRYRYPDNDNVANGKSLYRLKIVDVDGRYTYSNVLPVELNCNSIIAKVFPNPVSDGKLYISISGSKNKAIGHLLSATGQTVLKTTLVNGTNLISVKNISSGIYMMRIEEAGSIDKQWKVIINN